MLKGVNKQILEISNPESPYFEKIIFFVKPDGFQPDEKKLRSEAEKISKQSVKPPKTRRSRRELLTTAMCVILGLGAGASLTVIMGLIS